ncbi:hypothetical protein, partial [Yersinia enterocolitica]|uniref:hypothetical protein n=1 Tax=Yersinia enterocolitica TaxID=630 RepID=UPI00313EE524
FVKTSILVGSSRAIPGADALLFYLSSPPELLSLRFVCNLINLVSRASQRPDLFMSDDELIG